MKVNLLGFPNEVDATVDALRRWMSTFVITGEQTDPHEMLKMISIECTIPHQWMSVPRPDGPLYRHEMRQALADLVPDPEPETPNQRRPRRMH